MRSKYLIQILHLWNAVIALIIFGLLVGVSSFIKWFINLGSSIAGFGGFTTFAYPATFVFMFIPTISAIIYSLILVFDSSPQYRAWLPSKTMQGTIIFFTVITFLSALLPVLPNIDIMTDRSSIECLWTNYMQWTTIYNNPIAFPWVTGMEKACSLFKIADIFAWILWIGWLAQSVLYLRAAHYAKFFIRQ
ncbi:uncharacterized protein BX663DRAFT_547579 [Cokeromyces recurvatus]|uniref:uncharacterized protein n=1 Tax=Cokeromyces recurvatus TaxID=90255 RepID=UPI002220C2A3|nr:uncharacterized protein BX663DRAFT_547579 [Cokeromyces recurvatus]KAI7907930.1 hypothetical protein BX663DRAFT_547579 [Cokeromyces recurvatus]